MTIDRFIPCSIYHCGRRPNWDASFKYECEREIMLLVLRGRTIKQRKGQCCFFPPFLCFSKHRQQIWYTPPLFVYIHVPRSRSLAPPSQWHHTCGRWKAMIGLGPTCNLSCLLAESQQELKFYNCLIWHSDYRNRQKYCVVWNQHKTDDRSSIKMDFLYVEVKDFTLNKRITTVIDESVLYSPCVGCL